MSIVRSIALEQMGASRVGNAGRVEFIDLAKGVCILLVIVLHCCKDMPNLAALRMPLYFMLSGLFYRDYAGVADFIERKFNRMIVPALFFTMLYVIVMSVEFLCLGREPMDLRYMYTPITENHYVNLPLWFLTCLFMVNVIYRIIRIATRGQFYAEVLAVVLCGLCGYILSANEVELPLFISTAFTAVPFFFAGRVLSFTNVLTSGGFGKYDFLIGVGLIVMSYAIYFSFGSQHILFMCNSFEGSYLLILLNSFSFTIGVLLVCKRIGRIPIVSYAGRYSIILLCTHYLYMSILFEIGVEYGLMGVEGLSGIILLTGTLLLSLSTLGLFRRYLPWFTAQKDLIRLSRRREE